MIALATSADHPGLEPDSRLLLPALARLGVDAQPVDLVRGDDGTLRLIELEAIEPLLFIAQDRSAADRFGRALIERLGR